MPAAIYLFEIPVYRCDPDSYYQDYEERRGQTIRQWLSVRPFDSEIERAKKIKEKEADYDFAYHRAWNYNEVIGWIRVFNAGGHIKGELWFVNKRVSRTLRNKIYIQYGNAFECGVSQYDPGSITNEEFFDHLMLCMQEQIAEDHLLSKYFIDYEAFANTGRYFDWKKLIAEMQGLKGT